jgi:hypothetical protein
MIAVAGENRIIRILDRQGKNLLEFPSSQQPRIESLCWDKDNDSLAVLTVLIYFNIFLFIAYQFNINLVYGPT